MAVIDCATCGMRVNAGAAGCPSCGGDPRVKDERRRLSATPAPRRHSRHRAFRVLLWVLLGLAVLLFAGVVAGVAAVGYLDWQWSADFRAMPSDRALLDNLADHERDFQVLVRMLHRDERLQGIRSDSTDPGLAAARITEARLERYRELMGWIGIEAVWRDPDGTISLRAAYAGGALTSDDRGYVYSEVRLRPLVESLDGHQAVARTAYRHIAGDWYLYRWIDP